MTTHITNTRFTIDQSADLLSDLIAKKVSFIFARFGDGALECISGKQGRTCDGELYSESLGKELTRVWNLLFTRPRVYLGDWFSASFSPESSYGLYQSEYEALIQMGILKGGHYPTWIHFESLLFMRESESLVNFYRTIRNDSRKKVLMGPKEWRPAASILKSAFIEIPISADLFERHINSISQVLKNHDHDFDVLLYGAGMAGNIPVIDFWNTDPTRTFINLGSALDPIYRGRTRRQQLPHDHARALFESIIS